ncbi:enolase 2-like [Aristolochia californica]|uniref:enolase 2-like n=1 Tax=Aristolochia californica TaxID=171875 RepID=UPI0035D53D88
MVTIKTVKARQVFDSRGNPTVEVDIICSNGTFSRAAVLNGASTGISEPLKLKNGGSDYLGKGVLNVVEYVDAIIGHALIGKDPTEQTKIDNFMVQVLDRTVNERDWCKPKLGATAILAISLAIYKIAASVKNLPLYQHIANLSGHKTLVLPVPAFNVLNEGSPAGNKLALQKFMILPVGASSFKEAMQMGVEVYHHLKVVIKKNYGHAITSVHALDVGRQFHSLMIKAGFFGDVYVGSSVFDMYAK